MLGVTRPSKNRAPIVQYVLDLKESDEGGRVERNGGLSDAVRDLALQSTD